jgi:hypothetical protein
VTAVLVGAIIKHKTPAPLDEVLHSIRELADAGPTDPDDGLVREEFTKPRKLRTKKSIARLREFGLGKGEIQALRSELGVDQEAGAAAEDQDA